ncbi:MAG: GspE/PulE family protein [Candidatus Gastranaerophilaceae bacterium]
MSIKYENIEELEHQIDYAVLRKFNYEDLIALGFLPLSLIDNQYGVLILSEENKEDIKKLIESKVSHTARYNFTLISDQDFKELLGLVDEHFATEKEILEVSKKGYNLGFDEVFGANNAETAKDGNDYKIANEDNLSVSGTVSASDVMGKNNPAEPKKKIGEVLIEKGLITEEQLFDALVTSKRTGTPIGSVLVQKNYVALDALKEVLTTQRGFETVDSSQLKLSKSILSVLPDDFVKLNMVIPIRFDGKTLVVGMVNPNNKQVINDIVYLTGLKPRIMLITHYEFLQCIKQYYNDSKKETSQYIEKIEQEINEAGGAQESLWEQAEKELEQDNSVIIKFVNKIITDGIKARASDIHIEPRLSHYIVRYRIDGVLREYLEIPNNIEGSVLTRLKVVSKMNIAEHRRPQDGTFSIRFQEKSYDFRINTIPVGTKEKMVIRILAVAESLGSVDKNIKLVGATKEDLARIERIKKAPNGIILASGPTGSGKTTTLYSIVRNLNDEGVNIMTIEDPIEIRIEGINQTQINPKAGITFASCLRAALRQDPDIILVGEIRDIETAEIAIAAALTGHLVLSTIHTNSAAATVTRLIEMGAKDYLVSSTLTGVIAQRLVRKLCDDCKIETYPTEEEARLVMSNEEDIKRFMKMKIYKPGQCEHCKDEGYVGRLGLYEVLQVTKEIKKLIAMGAHDIQIEEAAIGGGMRTLQQSCLHHIISGLTTIDEFVRVLGPVNE